MLVIYAGVSACGDVQSCLAQCPKYFIGFFFHFHLASITSVFFQFIPLTQCLSLDMGITGST